MSKDNPSPYPDRNRLGLSANQASVCHNWQEDGTPSLCVINAIAATTDTAPDRLKPLYETIDPDSLDTLFESVSDLTPQTSQLSVSFRYEGCDVIVRGNGQLFVRLIEEKHD